MAGGTVQFFIPWPLPLFPLSLGAAFVTFVTISPS